MNPQRTGGGGALEQALVLRSQLSTSTPAGTSAVCDTVERCAGKTDPIQKIILIIIIIIIIIIIKSQGKIAAAFHVFVGGVVMGFPKQNTTFFFLFLLRSTESGDPLVSWA